MRLPTARDQCQAILIEVAWLRDFADQKNIERGRVMCGGNWFTPQQIEAVRERARKRATRAAERRPGSSSK